jgi:DNA invertase Pin-like site-specific DNA recombinase
MTLEEEMRELVEAVHVVRFAYRSKGGKLAAKRCGSGHGNAKLVEAQVIEIRRLRAEGVKLTNIAVRYGVHKSTIQYALKKGWKHV